MEFYLSRYRCSILPQRCSKIHCHDTQRYIELPEIQISIQLFHHRTVIENIPALKFDNYVDITIIIVSGGGLREIQNLKSHLLLPLFSFSTMMILLLLFPCIF